MIGSSLETILKDIKLEKMPVEWQWSEEEMKCFSSDKSLFDFQINALNNALKTLWLSYGNQQQSLKLLAKLYTDNQIEGIEEEDVNRIGFWMATGSGKTLVIVKIIEMLTRLMKNQLIEEQRDIMFLVYRDNLLDQFKKHVNEYNIHNTDKRINLIDLKDYERTKHENAIPFSTNEVNVFYYRADLFLERKSTAKKIDPHSCDNNGKWFVLLDEAHRGESRESTYKNIYNRLSRNGFIFNFSATFTDDIDLKTCGFNFNLEKFIQEGYGKQIYVSGQDIEGFKERDDFADIEKQRVVLKTLILQAYISQHYKKIKKIGNELYHKPLLLTITNTVQEITSKSNKAEGRRSDLRLFFAEIERVANGNIDKGLFDEVKQELKQEMGEAQYLFGRDEIQIDKTRLSKIQYKHVLEEVFNTKQPGKIEVIHTRGNNQEVAFQVMTADRPFALIRIGNTSKWMSDILHGYQMTQHHTDDSFFESLNNKDSDINILMGSRTFYEGWDSNRPNIILFVNIGLRGDAKKFVLQSIGRGVRIEPQKDKRKRLQNLSNANEIEEGTYTQLKNYATALESLFIFGTNAENLEDIIKSLRDEADGEVFNLGNNFILNPDIKDRLLLIPIYKQAGDLSRKQQSKYPISERDIEQTQDFIGRLDNRVLVAKYGYDLDLLTKARDGIGEMSQYREERSINNPELILDRLFCYFNLKNQEFNKFNRLGDEDIIHFKKIQFRGSQENYDRLKAKISVIQQLPEKENQLELAFNNRERDTYDELKDEIRDSRNFSIDGYDIDIRYLANHYYHPLLISNHEKVEYLTHIIKVPSEGSFLKELEKEKNIFSGFDWWLFSKLDETLDNIYIPYYNYKTNNYSRFNPDFIFWLQKGKSYHILFVDPKGFEHSSYQNKIDGYSQLFGEVGGEKTRREHGLDIQVHLRLFGKDIAAVGDKYIDYWIDKPSSMEGILKSPKTE